MKLPALLLAGFLIPASVTAGATVTGPASIIDGSTLSVEGNVFRLADTVAPGRAQLCRKDGADWPCGEASVAALEGLIAGRPVKCDAIGRDFDGTALAVCFAGDEELNRAMIAAGMALAQWQVGLDYSEVQTIAKTARLGLWTATFDDPAEWRRKHAAGAAAPHS